MSMDRSRPDSWIDDVELEDVVVKWNWSNFAGRKTDYDEEGEHNFTIVLPEQTALEMRELGWTGVKENPPMEEGDPVEWTLKVKISYKFEAPKIYLLKGTRKIRADERDLSDIRRDTTDQIDVILTPSRWVNGPRTGITAYAKELYATVRESRFSEKYADYEEV